MDTIAYAELKALLLNGTEQEFEFDLGPGTIKYRPLSVGEQSRIEAMLVRGVKSGGKVDIASGMPDKVDMQIDLELQTKTQAEAVLAIVSAGISDIGDQGKTSIKEIEQWRVPFSKLEQLAAEIKKVSGMGEDNGYMQYLESFRKNSGGRGNDGDAEGGTDVERGKHRGADPPSA